MDVITYPCWLNHVSKRRPWTVSMFSLIFKLCFIAMLFILGLSRVSVILKYLSLHLSLHVIWVENIQFWFFSKVLEMTGKVINHLNVISLILFNFCLRHAEFHREGPIRNLTWTQPNFGIYHGSFIQNNASLHYCDSEFIVWTKLWLSACRIVSIYLYVLGL